MSAKELPARPSLEHYRKQAKDLLAAMKAGDPDARRRFEEVVPRRKLAAPALADAQLVLAREHDYESWPKFAKAIEGTDPAIVRFEAAVEAIISGDVSTLGTLLREDPELIRRRSTRRHRAMLLHYVGANGVEGYRQKTPKNAVQVATMLLDAGAEIDALADLYGGSATLGLIATSVHPKVAGVQDDLIELFLARGAKIDRGFGDDNVGGYNDGAVVGCLANGRGDAALHLASRGGRLTLEGAAGVGRLDVVQQLVREEDGALVPPATQRQLSRGFNWACEYGRPAVVEYLVQRAVDVRHPRKGEQGLHWAAYGGHPDVVEILLRHGAPVNAIEETYHNTPLGWALHAFVHPGEADGARRYYDVVAQLVAAGGTVQTHQMEAEHVRKDPQMVAALRGERRPAGSS